MAKLHELRQEYLKQDLSKKAVEKNPIDQFEKWFVEAVEAPLLEPNAMILATANAQGKPSSRIVLLKQFDEKGLTFFTNYKSRKSTELFENPFACLLFPWHEIQRQVRIEGEVEQVSSEESDDYFTSRPVGSRIGAWASPQSTEIPNRKFLEIKEEEVKNKYPGENIPRPPHWGGFRLVPNQFEFWQGRASRLHDRIQYIKNGSVWELKRLAP